MLGNQKIMGGGVVATNYFLRVKKYFPIFTVTKYSVIAPYFKATIYFKVKTSLSPKAVKKREIFCARERYFY